MEASQYSTQNIDHLGIVAGMCKRIGLIGLIDEQVKDTGRAVSVGQAVQAMVLNGLGFVSRPLYLTPEFFQSKPIDMLIGEGVTAEQLNGVSLGRALDHLYEAGVTEVFAFVAAQAIREVGIETDYVHLDSTSFALHGEYEFGPDEEAKMVEIRHGYSRDRRPDLKQVVLSLICTHQAALPIWLKTLSGNSADVASFPETVRAYLEQLKEEEKTPYLVADTALYTTNTLQALGEEVKWVTRVPASISLVKELYNQVDVKQMYATEDGAYHIFPLCSVYAGVRQRWVLVYSEARYRRQEKLLRKRIDKARQEGEKELRRLGRREYPSPEAAQAAVDTLAERWPFHTASVSFELIPHFNQAGRPARNQAADYFMWKPVGEIHEDQEAVESALARKGKFVLATNDLDEQLLSIESLISVYKSQNTTVERGFRFLKDPLFFAHSLFLKKPSRIMALLMVMGLCLLIYSLAEHLLRTELLRQDETLPDQKGKPVQRITLRRVFQVFEGIHILLIHQPDGQSQRLVLNLNALHCKILRLLGPAFENCYFVPT